jgi:transposase
VLDLTFTDEDIQALREQRFAHPHPMVQLKMETLYLRCQGLKHEEILRICHISKATYYRYLDEYQQGGVERLKQLHLYQPTSELQEQRTTLEAYFIAHPPSSVGEACAKIKELTGIQRQPTQVRAFLHSLGLKPRKVGALPAKADVEAQEQFRKNCWSRV